MFDASQPVHDGWVLKGGYALEMRFHMARSTKDLDLTVRRFQGARRRLDLTPRTAPGRCVDRSALLFHVHRGRSDGRTEYGARRRGALSGRCPLDGRTFVKFHVDLGVGDEVLEPLATVEGEDWLGFAGISAVVVPALSVEQHWAEKFHAYTRQRATPNSRVRDLVDLVLILEREPPMSERMSAAVDATFSDAARTRRPRLCLHRPQTGRNRSRLSPPIVGWTRHWRRRMNELKPSGEVCGPGACVGKIAEISYSATTPKLNRGFEDYAALPQRHR